MQDFIVEIDGRMFVDVVKVLPRKFNNDKRIIYKNLPNNTDEIYIKKAPGKAGHDSKKFVLNRFMKITYSLKH
ncbi:MAG: hypothetical protein QMD36_00870 [Candidatus Aenigmarchaeota archaeon]|nr:hypothetical protein [Candidatus Aenigmarchaeota archaeon]